MNYWENMSLSKMFKNLIITQSREFLNIVLFLKQMFISIFILKQKKT